MTTTHCSARFAERSLCGRAIPATLDFGSPRLVPRHGRRELDVVGIPRLYQVSPARWKEFVAYYGLDEVRLDPAKPNRRLAAFCRARGIPFLDLAPGIAAAGDPEPLYRGHWTAAGNEAAAMLILQALERGGML